MTSPHVSRASIARNIVVAIAVGLTSSLSHGCKPSPGRMPPTVEELVERSTYVVYAEVVGFEVIFSGERRGKIKVIEQFKGPPIDTIGAAGHSCAPNVVPGRRGIYFLNVAGNGHALEYPYTMREADILEKLRALRNANASVTK